MKKTLFIIAFFGLSNFVFGQCYNPVNVNVTSVNDTSVTLNIITGGTSPWQIEYGVVGFALGSGTIVNVTSKTPTVFGLNGSTTYDVYVRDTCNGTVSQWVGPTTFNTSCSGIAQAPVLHDFESSDWNRPLSIFYPSVFAPCWSVIPSSPVFSWSVGPPLLSQILTGPNKDHTLGYGKYLHVGSYGISSDSVTTLKMPTTSLVGLTTPEIVFWYHMFGADIEKLEVHVKKHNALVWDTITTLVGQHQFANTDLWKKSTTSLALYLNDTIDLRFVGYRKTNGTLVEMSIDDLSIADIPTCPKPSTFRVTSNNDTSALLDWIPGAASHWQIEYGPLGFALGSGIKLNTSVRPFRINNLLANSKYAFYVRDSCNATDQSGWVGPILLETDCAPISAPYAVNFDTLPWVKPAMFGQTGTLDNCWKRKIDSAYFWDVGPPLYSYIFTGPDVDHTTGTGQFLMTSRNAYWGDLRTFISTPIIDLDTIVKPELTFWYHMYGVTIAGLDVEIDSGNGYANIFALYGQQQTYSSSPWKEAIIDLSAYAGKKVKVKFTGRSVFAFNNLSQIGLDDFSLTEADSCPKPRNLAVTDVGYTDADLSWTTGGASLGIVKYKSNSGTYYYNTVANSTHTISGLQPNTAYTAWIRDSCGNNDVSVWNGPLKFRTNCSPQPTPYFENFDGNSFVTPSTFLVAGSIDNCWKREYEEGFYWETGPVHFVQPNTGPIGDYTTGGGQYLVSDLRNFVNKSEARIHTPAIDLSNLTVPELSFWYHMYGSGIRKLEVEIDTGFGWVVIDSIVGQQQNSKTSAWLERKIDLSSYADTIIIRFVSYRNLYSTASEIAIDNFHIYEKPNCDKPKNVRLKHYNNTTATFKWKTGGATDWIVRYKTSAGAYTYQAASTNNLFQLAGLLPDTRYEFWVRDSCGVNDVGLWVGPKVFRTDCNPTTTPYLEDFDGMDWVPATPTSLLGKPNTCWKRSDTTYLSWIPNTGNSTNTLTGPASARQGAGNYMLFNNITYSLDYITSELKSPAIIINNLVQPELNFWYYMYGAQIGSLAVYAEKMNGSRTFLDSISGQQQFNKVSPWKIKTIPLTSFINDTIKVVFVGRKSIHFAAMATIAIDDVEIVDAFCYAPTNLSTANVKAFEVDLLWTSTNVRSSVEYGLTGFFNSQGTVLHNVTSGYNLAGLQPFTTYDFYVQDSCRVNNSTWTGPQTFTTFCDTPTANFSTIANHLNITFVGDSTGGSFLKYNWDFGDGTMGAGNYATHAYNLGGSYNITLIVTDTCGLTDTISQKIEICPAPLAVINYTVNNLVVYFDGSQSIDAVSYFWDFGPAGNYVNSKPNVTFPAQGNYLVWLEVTDSCGGVDTTFLNLALCDKPTSFFTYSIISSGGAGMTVKYDGSLSQKVTSFLWDFGDGDTNTTHLNPTHTYAVPGLHYEVSLITYSFCGRSDTLKYKLQDVVSMDEWDDSELKVYPNPVKEKLKIEITDPASDIHFAWFGINGQDINVPFVNHNNISFEFDVSALKPGEYILVVTKSEMSKSVKIVVK